MKNDGAVTLITGGASGLGFATARALHGRGAKVGLLDLPSSAGHAGADTVGAGAAFTPPRTSPRPTMSLRRSSSLAASAISASSSAAPGWPRRAKCRAAIVVTR